MLGPGSRGVALWLTPAWTTVGALNGTLRIVGEWVHEVQHTPNVTVEHWLVPGEATVTPA
eukprot:gene16624-60257_t